MASVNRVILLGNVGQDPEIYESESSAVVARFSLATNERWRDADGKRQERTEWHRIVAFGRTAEIVRDYVAKGRQLYVEGALRAREWIDADGTKRNVTNIVVTRLQLLGAPKSADEPPEVASETPGEEA